MKIQVHGDNIAVTSALQDYVDKKIGRLTRYFEGEADKDIHVTMAVEGAFHRVEMTVYVHGVIFRAEEQSQDMYASIDLVTDKLEQQVQRYKEKINRRFRDRGLRTRIKQSAMNGAFHREDNDAEFVPQLVRVKRFPIKPMDVEEAMMQMDLLGHDFYVFTNAETDEVNVVYRRKNGDYGLIEPQN
ncbi:ribosome hibernation-promoting factor, HPF/YfiA family [Alicyclobacillus dauci]|uniref:Ribosome hibernation promoting factor n=1 Tax=Alicyclobacillus dauci TaxID=1475485 RepID=A0ABY6Z4X1_9BACL|nr:ribosome-associated translation inhibitor RaiA [Alicyclobacillus dauci]WAH37708.1 ribosome-associated translation inhibitor RaiA [Alicyclobacillus dauci]